MKSVDRFEQDAIAAAEDRAWFEIHAAYERGDIETFDDAQQKFLEWRGLVIGRVVIPDTTQLDFLL